MRRHSHGQGTTLLPAPALGSRTTQGMWEQGSNSPGLSVAGKKGAEALLCHHLHAAGMYGGSDRKRSPGATGTGAVASPHEIRNLQWGG